MIIGLFSSLASTGGVQMAGRHIAAALHAIANDRGWRYAFLSLNDTAGEHEMSVGEWTFQFEGFARSKARFALKTLSRARESPKIVFAAHPNLAPIAAMTKAAAKDTRTVVGAHGIEVWQPLPVMRRRILRYADMVTAPSSDTARRLAKIQYVPTEKIRRLPWPLDPEFANFARFADQLVLPKCFPSGQVVLSVGRWAANERYKGADLLIQAVAELSHDFPELHLVLAGAGDDLSRLRQQAQDSGVKERIHFLTELSRRELAACYAAADVFALPSTGEGFGLVFLEAMAFGKPVIGTNVGGIRDLVENGCEGFLIEPNIEAISETVKRLLSDSRLGEELGARGKKKVNTEFTFESFQWRLLAILNEIV